MVYLDDEPDSTSAEQPGGRSAAVARHAMGARLLPAQFISQVATQAASALRSSGFDFQIQTRGRLVKLWSGSDMAIHYEVAAHERDARLEIGFHMEAEPEVNEALYRDLDKCLLEIQASLGSSVWLEPWDKGWVRLYETQPLWPLDSVRVDETVERLVELISTVQPIFEALAPDLQL